MYGETKSNQKTGVLNGGAISGKRWLVEEGELNQDQGFLRWCKISSRVLVGMYRGLESEPRASERWGDVWISQPSRVWECSLRK